MPTALVPFNRFANAPQPHGMQNSFDGPPEAPPFATFQHDEKAITFHNIADGNLLQVAAPSTEGAPDMKMEVKPTGKRNTFRATYTPDGYSYRVQAAYGGKPMQGFPVTFAAKEPYVEQNIPSREFKIHNVYQPNLVSVHTPTLPHAAEYNDKDNSVTVKYNPEAGPGMHDVHVQYKKMNSRFRLAPRPRPAMVPMSAPMMYQATAYGGGAYPQLTAAPAMGYAQPMQAIPAHLMQAGAPMMQAAPTLMAPVQMMPQQQQHGQPMLMVPQQAQQPQLQHHKTHKAVAGYAPMQAPAVPMQAGYYAPYAQQM